MKILFFVHTLVTAALLALCVVTFPSAQKKPGPGRSTVAMRLASSQQPSSPGR